jgi:phosphatidylglycerophosphate synthase
MLIAAPSGPTAASNFNSDLFIAVATLIPVLFLALAVQRDMFVGVLRAYQRFVNPPADEQAPSTLAKIPFAAGLVLVPLALIGILVAGGWGEPLAIYALYQRQAFHPTELAVLWSAIFLAIVTAIVASASFTGAMANTRPQKTLDTPNSASEHEVDVTRAPD